ncbi:MAG: methyl-accepting chemotaxis protein [Steroidobacteraceae bacterium]
MVDKMNGVKFVPALAGLALLCVLVAAVLLVSKGRQSGSDVEHLRKVSELVTVTQKMPAQAAAAVAGKESAFDALTRSRAQYHTLITSLREVQSLPASDALQTQVQTILNGRDATLALQKAAVDVHALLPHLMQSVGNIATAAGPAAAEQLVRPLERFELAGQRIEQDLQAYANGASDHSAIVKRLTDSLEYMSQVLLGLAGGDAGLGLPRVNAEAQGGLQQAQSFFTQLSEHVRRSTTAAPQLAELRTTAAALDRSADQLYAALSGQVNANPERDNNSWVYIALGALVLAALMLAGVAVLSTATTQLRQQLETQANKNQRNQEAILRLLDELSNLADGDLTVQATVTEDITGAIADSINYAIEALRELVTTINGGAVTLDSSARQTQAAVTHLARASVAQSKQVALASESVAAMAASTEEVSGNAERSSDVARHSVDVAHKGGEAVRRTIDGMNAIRETIQETSKRIKRLGESSQEIGNIVELINDIAEQTNILALNASIQASMAGEAGRGFAVVADEVQRLAERAANATKQIEVLVRTIQADTNEAVVSMERSTTDVVGGALLAENAGAALEEIEQVSNQIASLVQNISASSRQQASAAQNIAKNMQVLREISTQTAENSAATTNSVGKLAELSTQLRKSIAGFRLPDMISGGTALLQEPASKAATDATHSSPRAVDTPVEKKKVSGLSA